MAKRGNLYSLLHITVLGLFFVLIAPYFLTSQSDPGENVSAGTEEIIMTAEQRSQLGLNYFPDGNFSGWQNPDDPTYTFFGANGGYTAKVTGTLSTVAQTVISLSISLTNPKSNYAYASGRPFYYDAQTGRWLFSYHAERYPNGMTNYYYATIGLAYSEDNGDTIIDLGEILRAEVAIDHFASLGFGSIDVEGGPIVAAPDGYFYVFYNEYSAAGQYVGTAVARAAISDVVAATRNGELSPWAKYYNGTWDQPAMGGLGSQVVIPPPFTWNDWCDASWNIYLNKFVMICAMAMHDSNGIRNKDFVLYYTSSPDAIEWDNWAALTPYPETPVRERLYPSIIGLEDGNNLKVSGKKFFVFYTNSYLEGWLRWGDASINRIEVTLAKKNAKEDLLGTWDGQGVYFRNSETNSWTKLATSAELVAAGDLDRDYSDDLIGVWPGQGGVWARYSKTGAWAKLSSTAKHIAAGDMNGDGREDLLGTWDGQGVYYRDSLSTLWVKLASPATLITAGDLDGDNKADLIGIWPTQGGVWVKYSKTDTWTRLSSSAQDVAAGDMNGDGREDLLGTWDGQGVYYRDSASGLWTKMSTSAEQVAAGDLDGDGTDDLIGSWTSQGGIWVKYSKTSSWSKLSAPAKDICGGAMARAIWGSEKFGFMPLDMPAGGVVQGPEGLAKFIDLAAEGPGGWRFAFQEEMNLVPQATSRTLVTPGPGEPGFRWVEQQNLFPREQETAQEGKKQKGGAREGK